MRIAYRRMSGPIGLTKFESGTRGLWLEKRIALVRALRARGHRVDYVNRMTKFSQSGSQIQYDPNQHEVLIVEFGSSNRAFYGEDISETERMVSLAKGRIIFVCDDPDLPYIWKTVPAAQLHKFMCWYNAAVPVPFGGQPDSVPIVPFPIAGLMEDRQAGDLTFRDKLIYIGRPNGREAAFRSLLSNLFLSGAIEIYSKPSDWKDFPCKVHEAPPQAQRGKFYAKQLASLVIADSKHKRMGWYTGRAFHAIAAGCPAIAEHDHVAMTGLRKFAKTEDLIAFHLEMQNPSARAFTVRAQQDWVRSLRTDCERAFRAAGL